MKAQRLKAAGDTMRAKMCRDRAGQWHKAPYVIEPPATRREFQERGVEWMRPRQNSLLGDDMGLGKTAQAIGIIDELRFDDRTLIVCPAGLRLNWLRELAIWMKIPRACAIAKRYIPPAPIVIVSIDSLPKFETQLRAVDWALIVLDEAHLIRNNLTMRARQLLGDDGCETRTNWMPDSWATNDLPAQRKIALTGTPMPNRPMEIWPILRFLGLQMNRQEFGLRFCGGPGDFNGSSNPDELRALLGRYMLRRTKSEVLTELPEKTRQIVRVTAAGGARSCVTMEGKWERQVAALEGYNAKVAMGELAELRKRTALAKLAMPVVQDIITEAALSRNKVVVFCIHLEVVEAVWRIFNRAGIFAYTYTGEMPTNSRQRAVDGFQANEDRCGFIATIGAGGVGITLTAASDMLFVEEDFTPGITDQAEDRCHRYGQRNAVMVRHIVLEGSYDERQLAIQVNKSRIISEVL